MRGPSRFLRLQRLLATGAVLSLALGLLLARDAHAPALAQEQTEEEMEEERQAMETSFSSISVEDAIAEFLGYKKKANFGPSDLQCFEKYEVQGGENLTRIARERSKKLGIKAKMIGPMGLVEQLQNLNRKRVKDLHYIYPGTELLLPPLLSSKIHTAECKHYKIPKYRKLASTKKYKCEDPGHAALRKRVRELEAELKEARGGASTAPSQASAAAPGTVEE